MELITSTNKLLYEGDWHHKTYGIFLGIDEHVRFMADE